MHSRENLDGKGWPLVAVAIDKNSQSAFRWAMDNIVTRGQTLIIIHVNTKSSLDSTTNNALREIFIPYQFFCSRKDVHCKDMVLEGTDVTKAIVEFVSQSSIEKLVIGASPKGGFYRSFRSTDLSTNICKAVPDFCTVIVISKGKVSSARSAVRPAPPPLRPQIPIQAAPKPEIPNNIQRNVVKVPNESALAPWNLHKETGLINGYSSISCENASSNSHTISVEEVEAEIRLLKLELKQTMDMYTLACKEAITAKKMEMERQRCKMEEEQRMREAQVTAKQKEKKLQLCKMEEEQRMRDSQVAEKVALTKSYGEVMLESDISAELKLLRLEMKQMMGMCNSTYKETITAKQKGKEPQ